MRNLLIVFMAAVSTVVRTDDTSTPTTSSLSIEIHHDLTEIKNRGTFRNLLGTQKPIYDPKKNGIFEESDLDSFRALLEKNSLYKIYIRTISDNGTSSFITSSIPACELQKSGFKEELLVYLDSRGAPIGVSYSSPVIALSRPCDPAKVRLPLPFHTRLKVADKTLGQSVPLHATGPVPQHLQPLKHVLENSARAQGVSGEGPVQPQPPQSFLQRYWYIVLMLVAYMIIDRGGGGEGKKDKQKKS